MITAVCVIVNHLFYKPIIIKPLGASWKINSYCDSFHDTLSTGDFSKIDSLTFDSNSVFLKSILGEGAKFAFAGITFRPDNFEISIKGYDIFEIEILPGCSDFNFTVTLRIPGFSDSLSANDSHKYHQKEFNISENIDKLHINFNELPTPAWWYSMNEVKREKLPLTDKTHCSSLSFSNHPSQKKGVPFYINIGTIKIIRDWKRGLLPFLMSCIISILLLISYFLFLRDKQYLTINPVEILDDTESNRVFKLIGKSYKKRGLSIEDIATETFCSPYQVRKVILEKYGCTFNEYLRKIRIEEGSRLLRETQMDIKQIALEVGFSHPTSFNRAFKEEKNVSPSIFRQQFN